MSFRVRIDPLAQAEIGDFAAHTADYSEEFATEQFGRLTEVLSFDLAEAPMRWSYFALAGPPYRAYLFRVGPHTQYWIIYTVDEDDRVVNVLRFWDASRNPAGLG